jgi:hypothetical protein
MTPASILEQHPDYKATDAIDVLRGTDDATLDVDQTRLALGEATFDIESCRVIRDCS